MIEKIFSFLKNPSTQRNLLLVVLVVLLIFMKQCKHGTDTSISDQNLSALQDSIRVYKNKNGELIYEKNALIVSKNELDRYNKELADQIKNMKDNLLVAIQIKTKIINDDTIHMKVDQKPSVYNSDSSITYEFAWSNDTVFSSDNYKKMNGSCSIGVDKQRNVYSKKFVIYKDEIGMSFITGLNETKDKKLLIFIQSQYPGFTPTSIQGALIDPKKSDILKKFFLPKKWSVGPTIGYGVYLNPKNFSVGSGVIFGVSLNYNLIRF